MGEVKKNVLLGQTEEKKTLTFCKRVRERKREKGRDGERRRRRERKRRKKAEL